MAVIEYYIELGNGDPKVTTYVVAVSPGDTIRFRSNDADAGIQYKQDAPFSASEGPQGTQPFQVGKGTKDLKVTKPLTAKDGFFKCGTYVPPPPPDVLQQQTPKSPSLKDAYDGDGTPPPDLAKHSGHGH